MSTPTETLATGIVGGFSGMAFAIVLGFTLIRMYVRRAFKTNALLKKAHEDSKCPICGHAVTHDGGK